MSRTFRKNKGQDKFVISGRKDPDRRKGMETVAAAPVTEEKICDLTGNVCVGCTECTAANEPSKEDTKEEKKETVVPRELTLYEVTFKVRLPHPAYSGFFKKLQSLGFKDVRMYALMTKTQKRTSCPMGYKKERYPMCDRSTCQYYHRNRGCQYDDMSDWGSRGYY